MKTHEKADRGERLKTEISESTEDEVAYLEAEVDALAHRPQAGQAQSIAIARVGKSRYCVQS
jgi:hypothetical protein